MNGENIHVHLVCAQKQSEGKKPDTGSGKVTPPQTPPTEGRPLAGGRSLAGGSGGGNSHQPSASRVVTGSTIPNVNHQEMPFVNPSLVPGMFPMFGAIPGGVIPSGVIPGGVIPGGVIPGGAAVAPMMWTPEQMAQMQQMYTQFLAQYNLQPNAATVAFPQLLNANIHANEPVNAPPPPPPPVPPVVPGVGVPGVGVPLVGGDQANPVRQEADDDDDENRDWLDLFYWLSRAVVLFSVVYFYSSFTRFILVVGIAILMYLHQIGFIFPANNRLPGPRQARPPGENRDREPSESVSDQVPETASDTERCSGLRLFWVIVSSLFTSLIPETQPPVNFN